MKKPYEMTREEWNSEYESNKPDGMPRFNSNGAGRSDTIRKLSNMEFLLYGVGKWIYDKACIGEEWALECLEFQIYDKYDMIQKKYNEEKLNNKNSFKIKL